MNNALYGWLEGQYVCEEELTIYTASELTGRLQSLLREQEELSINLACVKEIDTAGLQVLIMLKCSACLANKKLLMVSHSPAVICALETCGLVNFFGDPLLISAKD